MGILFEELAKRDCPVEEIRERFLGDEGFYHSCLKKMVTDENFGKLGNALREPNAVDAFIYAHALKGLIANMGLQRMYGTICKLVEPLRRGETEGLYPLYEELLSELKEIKLLCIAADSHD